MKALVLIFVAVLAGCATRVARIWPDKDVCAAAEYPNTVTNQVEVTPGNQVEAIFGITSKGNGGIELPGLGIRVYDSHDDGVIFRDFVLRCEWRDVDRNATTDFVVSGVAVRTDEKTGPPRNVSPVYGIFRYAVERRRFVPIQCSPEIHFWEREPYN